MSKELKKEVIEALRELKEAIKPKAVVFGLDRVLVDSSKRYEMCREEAGGYEKAFWDCFLSEKYMDYDSLRDDVTRVLRSYLVKGYRIIILAGRVRQTQARKTRSQLKRWRIPYHEIIFREKGDHREDHVYKLEELAKLMGRYRIEALYDGSDKVLEAVKGKYPRIKAVKV
ncbi:MAG: hypothetical protein F7B61_03300 [Caldisphaeraceae archaeon]|nr:hypothetical protein [Caldisphaeraceae archaeon]